MYTCFHLTFYQKDKWTNDVIGYYFFFSNVNINSQLQTITRWKMHAVAKFPVFFKMFYLSQLMENIQLHLLYQTSEANEIG